MDAPHMLFLVIAATPIQLSISQTEANGRTPVRGAIRTITGEMPDSCWRTK